MRTAQERIELIDKWAAWFVSKTESWYSDQAGELGAQLAYLFAAIATNNSIDLRKKDELYKYLQTYYISPTEDIWEYITLIED